jgi:hypothetical protein
MGRTYSFRLRTRCRSVPRTNPQLLHEQSSGQMVTEVFRTAIVSYTAERAETVCCPLGTVKVAPPTLRIVALPPAYHNCGTVNWYEQATSGRTGGKQRPARPAHVARGEIYLEPPEYGIGEGVLEKKFGSTQFILASAYPLPNVAFCVLDSQNRRGQPQEAPSPRGPQYGPWWTYFGSIAPGRDRGNGYVTFIGLFYCWAPGRSADGSGLFVTRMQSPG